MGSECPRGTVSLLIVPCGAFLRRHRWLLEELGFEGACTLYLTQSKTRPMVSTPTPFDQESRMVRWIGYLYSLVITRMEEEGVV